jgi:long-chain fatty acid transport protein
MTGSLLTLLLFGSTSFGSGYRVQQQGAEAGGMAHTGTTQSTSADSAWFNPALLTDDRGWAGSLGATLASARITATALETSPDAPWRAQTQSGLSIPPHLYVSYAKDQWATGLTVNAAHASSIEWPQDWPYRFDILSSRPQFMRVTAFGAYRWGPVSVAIGPQVDIGQIQIHKATHHISEEGSVRMALRGVGIGVHAALAYQPTDNLTLGLRYFSQTRSKLSGEADFDLPLPFASDYPDQAVSTRWSLPDHLELGVRWHHGKGSLAAELGLSLWSIQREVVFQFQQSDALVVPYDWRNALTLKLGGEWGLTQALTCRAGVYTDGLPAPAPAHTLSPASPDATRIGLTTGATVQFTERVTGHLSYEALKLLGRSSTSPDAPMARYEGQAHFLGLSASFAMP